MEKYTRNPFEGRHRHDGRYLSRIISVQIIDLLKVVRLMSNLPNREIANLIGVSSSNLSMAVGGRAGENKMNMIKDRLEDIILKE